MLGIEVVMVTITFCCRSAKTAHTTHTSHEQVSLFACQASILALI